jgi:UDP-glucose 4-epimerase
MLRLLGNKRAIGEVVNIGTDHEISIEGLAHFVKERAQSESPITFIPYDQAYEPGFEDMPRRIPSLEKLEKLTDFRPRTSLGEIVDRVIAHCRGERAAAVAPATGRVAAQAATD